MTAVSPAKSPLVLLVEDDVGIGRGLVRALEAQLYRVTWCPAGRDALKVPLGDVALVLLDLGLPDMDGLDLCRRLRRLEPGLSIVILTARGTETDVVVGLDAGADDYLVKPFRLAELLARLRAHTRRQASSTEGSTALCVGDVALDVETRRVTVAGGEVSLRAKEFDLLELLMRCAGKVVRREQAMQQVWGESWFGSTKTLDVHVASLRQRMGEGGPAGSRITTLRGVGYRFELPSGTE